VTAELTARLQKFVGEPTHPSGPATDEVSLAAIRRYVEAMGDHNPIYLDVDAARATGRAGVIAPPAMLGVWTMKGYRETVEPSPSSNPALALLAEAGFTTTPGVGCKHEYIRELVIGDRVDVSTVIAAVSDEKQTSRGPGHFVTNRSTFRDEAGEPGGSQDLTVFALRPQPYRESNPGDEARASAEGSVAAADSNGALPELVVALDRLGVIACTTACNDFRAGHYDPDIARSLGFADIFTDIPTTTGLVARYVTDWVGPTGRLRSNDLRLGTPFFAGDALRLTGVVTAEDDRHCTLQIEGHTSIGRHVGATVVVAR
jgi:acyl dehydratase